MSEKNLLAIIKRTSLFGRITSHADLYQLEHACIVRQFDAQQVIIREKERVLEVAIIISGQVRVCFSGGAVDSLHLGPGSLFGEMEYFEPSPSLATVMALDPTTLLCISHTMLQCLAHDNPMTGMQLYHGFLKTLVEKHKLVTDDLVRWKLDRSLDHVAHDLRSPLAALKSLNPLLPNFDSSHQELYGLALNRISSIADSLTRAGPYDNDQVTSVKSLFEQIASVVREKAYHHVIDANFTLTVPSPSEDECICEGVAFCRILANLLDNAVQARRMNKADIQVSAHIMPETLKVLVSDDGKGFPLEILTKLGNQPATYGKVGGHGIGLFQAIRTIEAWGGKFVVCVTHGQGATVCITLMKKHFAVRNSRRSQPLHTSTYS